MGDVEELVVAGGGSSSHNRRSLLRPRLGSISEKGLTVPRDPDALLEGWLKKRGTRIQSLWSERYFVLKGDQLFYYLKPTDAVSHCVCGMCHDAVG